MDYDKLIAPAAEAMRPSGIRKFFEGFGYTRLRRVWDEVNYLADSVSKGYVSIADLEKELEDYGITLR